MAKKTGQKRFQDCIDFIHARVDHGLAVHLSGLVARAQELDQENDLEESIGGEVSLGIFAKWHSPDGSKRHALRALLLCQRVYFSKLWACSRDMNGGTLHYDAFAHRMGTATKMLSKSLDYWKGRTENEIIQALQTFAISPQAHADDLATAATQPGEAELELPMVSLTRQTAPFPGHKTCYSAVMYWLFRSGLTSYRWMMQNAGTPHPSRLRDVFGQAQVIWAADRPFRATDTLPAVPQGHIVHLYIDTPGSFAGHWLVSNGDGTAYGRNNDEEDGRVRREFDRCNLDAQFRAYKGTYQERTTGREMPQQGIAEVIDPLQIPNRI